MKQLVIIGIWFLFWIAHYYQIAKHNLTLQDLVFFNYKKWSVYLILSFGIPAYMVTHIYTQISFVETELPNLLINYLLMACLFWGLDQFPKLICYGLYKMLNRVFR